MKPKQRRTVIAAIVVSAGAAVACEDALRVESPGRIPAGPLENPANAALLVNGAITDFECAFGVYVVVSGLVGEELDDVTQTADRWPYDRRDLQSSNRRYSAQQCD